MTNSSDVYSFLTFDTICILVLFIVFRNRMRNFSGKRFAPCRQKLKTQSELQGKAFHKQRKLTVFYSHHRQLGTAQVKCGEQGNKRKQSGK